jgi:hypothetical protein
MIWRIWEDHPGTGRALAGSTLRGWQQREGLENTSWHWAKTVGMGVLLALVCAWWMSWAGVSADSATAGVRSSARLLAYLQAVAIGTLSWLAAVLVVATTLLGVMLLLNALVHRLWPQGARQNLARIPMEHQTVIH